MAKTISSMQHSIPLHKAGAALILLALLVMTGAAQAQTQICEPRERTHAYPVSGEAYGGHNLILDAAPGLRLGLFRARWGWQIAVLDDQANDLLPVSTLRGGLPDPRELYGWHFRNADNTGTNTGEVNAPQHERRFSFMMPGDTGTASGTGWLTLEEFALTDLEPGQQARMMYLRFNACLMYPKTEAEIAAETDAASPVFLPEEEEMMRACGLDDEYELDAWVMPRMLGGDFDGDGSHDYAAYVRRVSDGARGAAICRGGTWLHVLGVDGPVPGSPMGDGLFGSVEAWRVSNIDDVMPGWEGEAPRPDTAGDVLVLERIEKELYSIYWDGADFRSHQHYRFVEP